MAAMAPSNFLAFNAEAQKKALDTKGESIAKGMPTCCTTCARAMCP
jgi:polyhydroxyalkanoate synthase